MHEGRRDFYIILLALVPILIFIAALLNWQNTGEPTMAVPGINVKVPRPPGFDKISSRLPSVDALNPVGKDATTQSRIIAIVAIVLITIAAIVVFMLLLDLFGMIRKSLFPQPPEEPATPLLTESRRDGTVTRG